MVRLCDLFDIRYGSQLDLNKCEQCERPDGYNFVNRSSEHCGVSARILAPPRKDPFPAGAITSAMGGSVLSSFVQQEPFFTGQNVKVLLPKTEMTLEQKLYYCACIEANRFRYSTFGREANASFDTLLVPDMAEMPALPKLKAFDKDFRRKPLRGSAPELNTAKWKTFRFDEIFTICKGYYNKRPVDSTGSDVPFIGATDSNNGMTGQYAMKDIETATKTGAAPNHDLAKKLFGSPCITVSNNGSVGYAFFQDKPFTCTHDVNPLYLKNRELNKYIALFLCTVIELDRYRWDYGRKWRPMRMPISLIKLPATPDGQPDWQFMENYVKSLPYSANL